MGAGSPLRCCRWGKCLGRFGRDGSRRVCASQPPPLGLCRREGRGCRCRDPFSHKEGRSLYARVERCTFLGNSMLSAAGEHMFIPMRLGHVIIQSTTRETTSSDARQRQMAWRSTAWIISCRGISGSWGGGSVMSRGWAGWGAERADGRYAFPLFCCTARKK